MSDLVGTHIVGFLTHKLIYIAVNLPMNRPSQTECSSTFIHIGCRFEYISMVVHIFHKISNQNNNQTCKLPS